MATQSSGHGTLHIRFATQLVSVDVSAPRATWYALRAKLHGPPEFAATNRMTNLLEHDPPASSRRRWLRLFWPIGIALLGFAVLPLDVPIARWFHDKSCPREILRWLGFAETYSYGFGVACILFTVFALDPGRRFLLPRAAATAFGGGLLANVLKLLVVARTRPENFDFTQTVGATFGQWLPLGIGGSGEQSFPSAHMATAFGLTGALIWLYPRGRWIFPIFAVLAGCQRMSSWAHFFSDVVWGAAAGCVAVILFLPGGLLACWFDKLEACLARAGRPGVPAAPSADGPRAEANRCDAA
jgi:membrane-associated phospholipid phosphatase